MSGAQSTQLALTWFKLLLSKVNLMHRRGRGALLRKLTRTCINTIEKRNKKNSLNIMLNRGASTLHHSLVIY